MIRKQNSSRWRDGIEWLPQPLGSREKDETLSEAGA